MPKPFDDLSPEKIERINEIRELSADIPPLNYEAPRQFSFPRNNTDVTAPFKNAQVSPEDMELYRKLMKMNMDEYRDEYENDLDSKTQGLGDRISEARGWGGSNSQKSVGAMSPYDLKRKKAYDNAFRKSSLAATQAYQGLQNTALEKAKAQSQAMGQQHEAQLKELTAQDTINRSNLELAHKIGLDKYEFDLERKKLRQSFLINLEQTQTQRLGVENSYKIANRRADIQLNKNLSDEALAQGRLSLDEWSANEHASVEREGLHIKKSEIQEKAREFAATFGLDKEKFRQAMKEWENKKAEEWKYLELKERETRLAEIKFEKDEERARKMEESTMIGNVIGGLTGGIGLYKAATGG
jgi:hypothetical protein